MAQEFKLPDLGEGIHEGEVVAVLVAVGDQVLEGQPILEVETDKARVEIPSPFSGTVKAIHVKPGEIVKVGHVLMVFAGAQQEAPRAPGAEPVPAPAPASPVAPLAAGPAAPAGPGPVPAAPSTRRLARELGVVLREVAATGPHGLVTAEDVRAFAATAHPPADAGPAPPAAPPGAGEPGPAGTGTAAPEPGGATAEGVAAGPAAPALPDFSRWGAVERLPLRSVRRATAKRLALSWAQIPHVNHQDQADITLLEEFRGRHKGDIEAVGGKLTLTVLVLKAVVAALKKYPRFNSSLDLKSEEIILKHYHHIGVAVDTERGLVVPVLRDVDCKSITELAVELTALSERTRSGQLTPDELQGGTFTITNIGALGGTGFAPLINYPQVAILGTGRGRLEPKVTGTLQDFAIVPRLMLPLVVAFDHRVLDGADAARFVNMIIEVLQDPEKLLL